MKRCPFVLLTGAMLLATAATAAETDKDVPWKAQAEIARRGALVERAGGIENANDSQAAIASAMQPPADDSHKWLFTLVTTRNCQWCDQLRRDFESSAKLRAWVDTKEHAKSWAHWQIVQIEDQSQAWRWKDYKPTAFPTLIVQPPVNGSWGDPHTIVYAQQGYLNPAELDAGIRQAIQLYAARAYPRRLAWEAKQAAPSATSAGGLQQARSANQPGGWTPPVTPPAPLPPLPSYPNYPSVPPDVSPRQPDTVSLLGQLLASLFGGPGMANMLLLAILAWQIYRGIAKREGIPLLIDDASAAQLVRLLQSLPRPAHEQQPSPAPSAGRPVSNG